MADGADPNVGRLSVGSPSAAPRPERPSLAASYQTVRKFRGNGFLYERFVSHPGGSLVASVAYRYGIHPSVLTLGNLVLGVGGSAAILAARTEGSFAALFVLGAVLLQIAYICDCADGQLARASGKTSPYGASLDPLVDLVVHISTAIAIGEVMAVRHELPIAVLLLLAGAWSVNVLTCVLEKDDGSIHSLLRGDSLLVSLIKLPRDYGLVVLVIGVWLTVAPGTLYIAACAVIAVNLVVLLARIIRESALSMRVYPSVVHSLHSTEIDRSEPLSPVNQGVDGPVQ